MSPPLVVPDASVILKWVLPAAEESDTDRALELREAILNESVRAIVPSLWWFEVGNTTARRFPALAPAWMAALLKFGLDEAPFSQNWVDRALGLTRLYGVSFYDAAYHALALVRKGVFVTADERYVARVAQEGAVVALREWTPAA
jgi:predicted nucleic acid-binding protein